LNQLCKGRTCLVELELEQEKHLLLEFLYLIKFYNSMRNTGLFIYCVNLLPQVDFILIEFDFLVFLGFLLGWFALGLCRRGRYPLGIVMAPTRELARQVEKEFREAAPSLDITCLYGGTPISQQMRDLEYGVDVVVGTPGRIIDLMKRGSLVLSEVQHVVLDEADQMLGVGFVDDIETILSSVPRKRHSMCFSATMPSWIRELVRKYLKDPLTIDLVSMGICMES